MRYRNLVLIQIRSGIFFIKVEVYNSTCSLARFKGNIFSSVLNATLELCVGSCKYRCCKIGSWIMYLLFQSSS
jgi:hypothetical protein